MNRFKELKVWQKSIDLAVDTYKITDSFPKSEVFGLTSQIRKSAVSIPSNIAEGSGRNTVGEFDNFLGIAAGSSFELETQYIIAKRVGYLENKEFEYLSKELNEVQKMLFGLKSSLKK